MANVKVKIDLKTLKGLTKKEIANPSFQKKLGERVVKEVLSYISVGKSPVRGQGRYKGYRVDRPGAIGAGSITGKTKDPKKRKAANKNKRFYPNSVQDKYPGKQKRPVNLELSGEMLERISWSGIIGGVNIGLKQASKKIRDRFISHNEGTNEKRNVPRRAILPTGKGEVFTPGITQRIKSLYLARIRQLIAKKK